MAYKLRVGSISLSKKTYAKDEIVNNCLGLALELIVDMFQLFDWDNPPAEIIREDQRRLSV